MKALRQLGFLKLSLRPERAPDEDHRVLELFRNRAELKKAYGGLQEETFRLKDLIKQQEGATQRVQEMLNTLEGRLGTAETAYGALVFYQLRRLWQSGRELITQFAGDLARQQFLEVLAGVGSLAMLGVLDSHHEGVAVSVAPTADREVDVGRPQG